MRISKSGIMKLKTVSLLCVGSVLLCGILACSNQAKQSTEENNDEQQLFIGDNIAVAQTQYGKVKGFILKGIYNFRGVPYGASTRVRTASCLLENPNRGKAFDLLYSGVTQPHKRPRGSIATVTARL